MARSRNIKPGFFKNEHLAQLAPIARIAFAGLWCIADRSGRLEDRPMRIKIEVLPYDDCDINAIICDLQDAGFLLRYETENNKYIQILNFEKHQSPHKSEAQSTIPAPDKHGAKHAQAPEAADTNRPDSLNTDSLNPSINAQSQNAIAQESFDEFWKWYPKKRDKDKSFKIWKRKKLHALADKITADVQYRRNADWDWIKDGGKYIPYPTTYLNNKRWEDDFTPIPEKGHETHKRVSAAERFHEGLKAIAAADEMGAGPLQQVSGEVWPQDGDCLPDPGTAESGS